MAFREGIHLLELIKSALHHKRYLISSMRRFRRLSPKDASYKVNQPLRPYTIIANYAY